PTTATSARVTARSTTRPAASGRGRRRSISRFRRTNLFPTAKSASADGASIASFPRFAHERKFDVPAAEPLHAMAGAPPADRRARLLVVHRLSDAAQPELLVDLRRHSHLHARRPDRHWRGAGDALHAARRFRLQLRRAHHARRELRLVAALPA